MISKLSTVAKRFNPNLVKIISNAVWLFADKVLQMGLGLFVGIWLARYLGPAQFGVYNYAISFVGMFSPIISMGLGPLIVRDIAREPSQKDESLGTAFVLMFIGSVATLLLSVAGILLLNPGDTLTHWLVAIIAAGTIFQAFDVVDLWFQSQIQSKHVVLFKQIAYVLVCIIRIGLIQSNAPLVAFAWAKLVELAFIAVGLISVYNLKGNRLTAWKISASRARELLRESSPLILAGLAIYIYSKIDQVMLGTLLSDKAQLGFYSVAVKLAEVFDFLPVILASSVLPKLTQLKEQGTGYLEKMQTYFDVMLYLWLLIAIPVSLFSSAIIQLLYGEYYAPAAPILAIYVWAQFGTNLGVARNSFLTVEGKLYYSLYFNVAGALLNVVLNSFLIPKYQAVGATVATLITYFAVVVLSNFLARDLAPVARMILRSLNPYRVVLRALKLFQ